MPAGRAERAVEANAKSIDGAEHSGTLKGVIAAVHSGIRIGRKIGGQCVTRTWS